MGSRAQSGQSLIECIFALTFGLVFLSMVLLAHQSHRKAVRPYQMAKEKWRYHDAQKYHPRQSD